MNSILSILDEIAATSSKNEKKAILQRELKNELLQLVFRLAYDKRIRFWQTERGEPAPWLGFEGVYKKLGDALNEVVNRVSSREITGNAAREFINLVAGRLCVDDQEVFWRVIERDLRVGCSESTANKVWPGLIPEVDFMLAESDMSRITYPAYCQVKADGVRAHLVWDGTNATLWTRGNNTVLVGSHFDRDMYMMFGNTNITLDGELVCYQEFQGSGQLAPLDRKTSNGIINKAIKGTISEAEVKMVRFVAWDMFTQNDQRTYEARFESLVDLVVADDTHRGTNPECYKSEHSGITLIGSHVVQDEGGAYTLYKKWRKAGHEGALLKNMNSLWEGKRVFNLCKMKAVIECEFACIGVEEGTGKYKGMMGALIMRDLDHKIEFRVGTGFSDEERLEYWINKPIGLIFTVAYNERIKAKGRGLESLFLPRSTGIRLDRLFPDSYEKILETEAALLK